jgi:hypothetical protein
LALTSSAGYGRLVGIVRLRTKTTEFVFFIKQRPIESKLFKKLRENLDKEHTSLLLHTEIWWLSRGKVLNRVLELKGGLQDYFQRNAFSSVGI